MTIDETIFARLAGGLGDLLLLVYDAGWEDGSGMPSARPASDGLAALLDTVRERHRVEFDRLDMLRDECQPREAPAWLRAYAERQVLEVRDAR